MIRPVKKLIIQAGSYNKHFYQIQCTLSSDSWLLSLNPPRLPTEQEIFGELKSTPSSRTGTKPDEEKDQERSA